MPKPASYSCKPSAKKVGTYTPVAFLRMPQQTVSLVPHMPLLAQQFHAVHPSHLQDTNTATVSLLQLALRPYAAPRGYGRERKCGRYLVPRGCVASRWHAQSRDRIHPPERRDSRRLTAGLSASDEGRCNSVALHEMGVRACVPSHAPSRSRIPGHWWSKEKGRSLASVSAGRHRVGEWEITSRVAFASRFRPCSAGPTRTSSRSSSPRNPPR